MSKNLFSQVLALQSVKSSRLNREFSWLTNDADALYDLL